MLTELGKFLREVFQEGDGVYSSKRLITILSFLVLVAAFASNTFFYYKISMMLLDNFMYIIIAGMGISTAEPIAKGFMNRRKKSEKKTNVSITEEKVS